MLFANFPVSLMNLCLEMAGNPAEQNTSDGRQHPEDAIDHTMAERGADETSSGVHEGQAQVGRSLPSETRVQERLQQESRKSKQLARAKQASRSAHKVVAKKSRQKGAATEM